MEISLSPLRTEAGLRVVAAVRDITARVAAETEAAHVRSVVDVTRDAVSMFERDTLRFTYVNQGASSQLGYSRDELLAMGPLHIKPMFSEGEFRALVDSLSPGQSHSYTNHRAPSQRRHGPPRRSGTPTSCRRSRWRLGLGWHRSPAI